MIIINIYIPSNEINWIMNRIIIIFIRFYFMKDFFLKILIFK